MRRWMCAAGVLGLTLGGVEYQASEPGGLPPPDGPATTVPGDHSLIVANWNVEWFGDPISGHGPADDALQELNVAWVISHHPADLWALQEVVNAEAWARLK